MNEITQVIPDEEFIREELGNYACEVHPMRKHKDCMFRMLFKDKVELLGLYNAIRGTAYDNPDDLSIVTLENAIYMSIKNDLAFILDSRISLYEHQSTVNPNLPVRDLFYVAAEYSKLTKDSNLYGSSLVKIPTPNFITFYNGIEKQPERLTYSLSDAFEIPDANPALELKVLVLNINEGYNNQLKEDCKSLADYAVFVQKVREYGKNKKIDEAVELAITECISEGRLVEFLTKNRTEAKAVSIFEYDEELHMQQEREESERKGRIAGEITGKIAGKIEDILELLEDYGDIPDELRDRIMQETALDTIKVWLKIAAKVESVEEFADKIN